VERFEVEVFDPLRGKVVKRPIARFSFGLDERLESRLSFNLGNITVSLVAPT
jgi:hypothetical protein